MKQRKELKVSAIENGTVIDHIHTKNVFQVIRILKLENCDNQLYFGTNLESHKMDLKGIIKVHNRFIEPEEVNKIALVAPTATLIEIKDYQVIKKTKVQIPDEVQNFIKCINPNCVTNKENVATKFNIIDKIDIKLHCRYCEKTTSKQNMVFI